jgi:TIR domain-containing protein/conflict system STAND superfamily ATPase
VTPTLFGEWGCIGQAGAVHETWLESESAAGVAGTKLRPAKRAARLPRALIDPPLWRRAVKEACDVFFSYHWRDHAAVERIARALIDRGVGVFLDRWYLAPGQPWPQALEAALARCRAVAIFLGTEGLGPWQQREKDLALDRQGREPGFPVIPVLLARSDPGLGFLKFNTWVDFSIQGQADPRTIEVLIAAIRGEPPGPEAGHIESAHATICPYRSLRPFREEDEPFFFGRAAFTETLGTTLARQSFVAVVGASDLPIGAKTWDAIDAAIRVRDKVLLILSKSAIESDWVENEVNKAFAEERRRKQVVLFPVRIDQSVMKTDEPWAALLRDQRNIGDFRKWKDHDAYQQAFDRVLRDLKQAPG